MVILSRRLRKPHPGGSIGFCMYRTLPNRQSSCDPFTGLNDMVCVLQYECTHGKFSGRVKVENGTLVFNGKPVAIFQGQDPATIKG
ncbi:Glyceraldehyde-3-Phosphate Dehydrogenase [Manis pentadactyla]|nr:Glyceraldehyde-3-Phosphate Dehydrogenase [Manis pentadactyla]